MKRVIVDVAVSLDGFIEGANGEVDWCSTEGDWSAFSAFLDTIDTIFYGRKSYELWGNWQPGERFGEGLASAYRTIHTKKKYVFTRSRDFKAEGAEVVSSNLVDNVKAIRMEPGSDIWLYGGASLVDAFLREDLIDVIRMAVHPLVLGNGKALFPRQDRRVPLTLVDCKTAPSGVLSLTYHVLRQGA